MFDPNIINYKYGLQNSSGSSLPLIFCIHVRSGPIYWGVLFTLQKILQGDGILHVKSMKMLYVMVFYM